MTVREKDEIKMKPKTCEFCIYWERANPTKFVENKVLYGKCSKTKYIGDLEKGYPKEANLILYFDFEGYAAFLYTGEKFGCNQFEGDLFYLIGGANYYD